MQQIKFEKDKLRAELREKRKALPPYVKLAAEEKMWRIFTDLATFRFSDTVLMFAPLKYELDLTKIAETAISKGKRIAYPKCDSSNLSMTFRYVTSPSDLKEGAYGIMEPSDDAPIYLPGAANVHDVCIIPAMTYDQFGYRIGYGKGYYDRWLPGFKGTKAGFIMTDFLSDSLPRGKFDNAVDIIITERGIITVK